MVGASVSDYEGAASPNRFYFLLSVRIVICREEGKERGEKRGERISISARVRFGLGGLLVKLKQN